MSSGSEFCQQSFTAQDVIDMAKFELDDDCVNDDLTYTSDEDLNDSETNEYWDLVDGGYDRPESSFHSRPLRMHEVHVLKMVCFNYDCQNSYCYTCWFNGCIIVYRVWN